MNCNLPDSIPSNYTGEEVLRALEHANAPDWLVQRFGFALDASAERDKVLFSIEQAIERASSSLPSDRDSLDQLNPMELLTKLGVVEEHLTAATDALSELLP